MAFTTIAGRNNGPACKKRQASELAPEPEAEPEADQGLQKVLQGTRVLLSGKNTKHLADLVADLGGSVLPMPTFKVRTASALRPATT